MSTPTLTKQNAPAGAAGAGVELRTSSPISSNSIIPEIASVGNPFEAIPKELKARPQWVVHKAKQPINPATGYGAKAGDPSTWAAFQTAVNAYATSGGHYDGIGFEFDNNGLVGIDLDTVRDPATGEIANAAVEIINSLSSYTEISPSGYGFHIICDANITLEWNKARLPDNGIVRADIDPKTGKQRQDKQGNPIYKKPEIEMYTEGRYFTVTGQVWGTEPAIKKRTKEIQELHKRFAPKRDKPTEPILRRGADRRDGDKDYFAIGLEKDAAFRRLWDGERPNGNESADDLALMNKLAYWCNCDAEKMVEAFVQSPHNLQKDPKHTKKAGRADYLQRTAKRAVMDCGQTAQERDQLHQAGRIKRHTVKESLKFMEVFAPGKVVPDLLGLDLNDIGNAERFLYFYKEVVRYNKEANAWYIWNGKKWEQDLTGKIYRLAIKVAKIYKHTADDEHRKRVQAELEYMQDKDRYLDTHNGEPPKAAKAFKGILQHATSCGAASRITAMIDTAGHAAFIQQDDLDQHKHFLTCANGTIDLRTGAIQPHNPAHYITKMVDVEYTPGAAAPTFAAFLSRTFQSDPDLMRYVQKVMGYCITGETGEQCFFIGYGTGANGKSTLVEAVTGVLAEHTQTIPTSVLMDKDKESGATPELARAKGARLVIASESKDIASLNEAQIKQLTGGDVISARPLYSQGFEFKPTFKIWLSTNHKPTIKGTDNGIWRRVHLIPFAVTIPEDEQDTQLPQKLQAEQAGILSWLIEGARLYYAEGLKKPEAVKAATEDYRAEMDVLGGFLMDCTKEKASAFTRSTELYTAYVGWCSANGVDAMKQNAFSRRLTDRGMTAKRTAIARGYLDIELTDAGKDFTRPADFLPVNDLNAPPEWK